MSLTIEYAARHLTKYYAGINVLNIADLSWKSGEFVALLGKNGCGKSTLMRLLAQQEPFDTGELRFNGESLLSTKLRLNRHIAYVTEEPEIPGGQTLARWFDLYRKIYPHADVAIFERLARTLEVDATKTLTQMSRGQKMKALICLHASRRPDVYLLDEITAVLDAGSRWALVEFLRDETRRGCLTVMSTNIASELQGFATSVVFLEAGRVIFSSPSERLREHFVKHRLASDGDARTLEAAGARRIGYNEDHTWTYLRPSESTPPTAAATLSDLRSVTIADVQAYFTAGEERA